LKATIFQTNARSTFTTRLKSKKQQQQQKQLLLQPVDTANKPKRSRDTIDDDSDSPPAAKKPMISTFTHLHPCGGAVAPGIQMQWSVSVQTRDSSKLPDVVSKLMKLKTTRGKTDSPEFSITFSTVDSLEVELGIKLVNKDKVRVFEAVSLRMKTESHVEEN
jgi:hypothetical protein